jgi:hypothetical protein
MASREAITKRSYPAIQSDNSKAEECQYRQCNTKNDKAKKYCRLD